MFRMMRTFLDPQAEHWSFNATSGKGKSSGNPLTSTIASCRQSSQEASTVLHPSAFRLAMVAGGISFPSSSYLIVGAARVAGRASHPGNICRTALHAKGGTRRGRSVLWAGRHAATVPRRSRASLLTTSRSGAFVVARCGGDGGTRAIVRGWSGQPVRFLCAPLI